MNSKTNIIISLIATVVCLATFSPLHADETKLTFMATIDRVAGVADDQVDISFKPGTDVRGEIFLDKGKPVPLDVGDGLYWTTEDDNRPTAHVVIDEPISSRFDYAVLQVQNSPGGKVAINCGNFYRCEPAGELETKDGQKWAANIVSIQAPMDIYNADYDLPGAIDLLTEIVAGGDVKMLIQYSNPAGAGESLRVILSLKSIDRL